MPTREKIDELLAEDDWIRRMARRLVPDPSLADDLAQDAWVSALGKSTEARALRPWLGGVLRNLLRSGTRSAGRRESRERAVARSEALPSTAELVEEVTLRREIADQLLALEEPYRSTLYLRFFRDLSLKKIARRMDVPVSTVHGRLQRGLEQMRTRLDRTHGGDRRTWALVLLPLAKPSGGLVATTVGGVVMSTSFKVAASILVAGSALGLWIQTRESQALEAPLLVATPAETASAADEPLAPVELSPAESARQAHVTSAPPPEATPAVDRGPATIALQGRVIDTSETPVAGIEVGFRKDGESRFRSSATTDAGGRFALEREAPEIEPWAVMNPLFLLLSGGTIEVRDPLFTTLALGVVEAKELILVVEPKLDFAGRVLDEAGAPIEDAHVAVRVHQDFYRGVGFTQFASLGESGQRRDWEARTDAEGAFRIRESCGGAAIFLDVGHPGFEPAEVEVPQREKLDFVVVLSRRGDVIDVTGKVIDAGGAPVHGAQVSMGHTIVQTDRDGAFTIHWSQKEAGMNARFVKRQDGVWVKEEVPLHIAAIKPGHGPAWLDLEDADLSSALLLQLGADAPTIAGTVVDEDDNPLSGIVVWAMDLTRFGQRIYKQGEQSARVSTTLEEELRGGANARGTTSGPDGSFVLTSLMPREYTLQVYDPRTAELGQGWKLAAGTTEARLVLPRDPSLARVAGRLVSSAGDPIPGVVIQVQRDSDARSSYGTPGPPDAGVHSLTTGADGGFEFPELATRGSKLLLFGERIFFRWVALEDFEDLENIEIVEPLLCELQVELLDDPALADRIQVLDGAGEEMSIVEFLGVSISERPSVELEGGRTGVLRVAQTARTLVLTKDGEEVARRPLALDPDARTVVRP